MIGPTRDEVERLAAAFRKATFSKGRTVGGVCGQTIDAMMASTMHEVSALALEQGADALEALAAENAALRAKLEAAEARSYALAVAIMGGEDAPGYADSVPTQALVDQQRKMAAEWVNAAPADEARAREAAAWEAAAKRCDEIARHEVGREAAMMKAHATYFRALTPPDATAALAARLDAAETRGWNAAIEAAAKLCAWHSDTMFDRIRALRRNTETSND